ncbi:AAA family ATPase [Methanoculleus oceani]|uniref:AAA+ ATPase domain-containing protein n=1 Tax=Methanoculleus oceani TaxID=2184756 RepID=A0ABD4TD83_9EURY|nr:AAA family ATPase [Methanoculleus sp. CWC-02]MCM2466668.1 hypothetical protein [Methanoculleus sp. CWC-02]
MFERFIGGRKKSNNPFDEFNDPYSKLIQAIEDTQYYINRGNTSAAISAFKKAGEKFSESYELITDLINYQIEDGELQIALDSLVNIQDTYSTYYDLAEYFSIDLREYKQLIFAYLEILKGLLLIDMGKHRVAIKAFDNALELDDGNSTAWVWKGQALLALENSQAALGAFEAALRTDWHSADAWAGKGDALLALERADEAIEAYSTALELNDTEAELYFKQLVCLIALERYEDALKSLNEILKFNEDNAVAWYTKYIILDLLGEEQSSLIAQNKALKIDPNVVSDPFIEELNNAINTIEENSEDSPQTDTGYGFSDATVSSSNTERTPTSINPSSDAAVPTNTSDLTVEESKISPKPKKPIPYRKGSGENMGEAPKGFACVAGMEELKERLIRDVIQPLKNPEKYKKFKVSIPNGILFYGPPGCGKTFIVRKLAEELGFTFIEVHHSSIGSSYMHGTAQNIATKFQEAIDHAPTILFFDEIEGMVPKRENLSSSDSHRQEEINEFLTQLNNASKHSVLVIGATNQPDLIDSAIMRSGRMDKRVYIPPPDHDARKALFRNGLTDRPCASDIDLDELARLTENYASSDIALIAEEAARAAVDLDRDEIDMEILLWKVEEIKPSLVKSQIAKYRQFEHLER